MYVLGLEQITKETKNVGGKAAHLGELARAGFPVPPAFVITTDAYEKFLEENKLKERIKSILNEINFSNPLSIKEASKKIKELILNSKIPEYIEKAILDAYLELSVGKEVKKIGGTALDLIRAGRETFVAVRSSATAEDLPSASFAGQMETLLNIKGSKKLLEAVKECWASLYTPRAIFYRKNKRIESEPSMGVIVQRMVNADKAGVMFTADPSTNDKSKIVIEAAWGLGESVVSGLVIPDVYVLDKFTGQLLEKKISNKKIYRTRDPATGKTVELATPIEKARAQVLLDDEIRKLWDYAKRIEEHYARAQDIEWCIERGRIYIVQTRPITTLGKTVTMEEEVKEGRLILEGLAASPGIAKGPVKIVHDVSELPKVEHGDILVARMTNPDMVPYMRIAAAIVTDEGGRTSHAAIVSRELGIPCVVGTGSATTLLNDGQIITVDGTHGKVYSGEIEIKEMRTEIPHVLAVQGQALTATAIKVNLAFPEMAEKVSEKADGVGLLRAEHMLTESGKHPAYLARTNPEELVKIIMDGVGRIAKAFYPKPVWYRSLDARTDEFRGLEGGENEPKEANPMLGWHGIRRSLDEPDVFKCEIEAIKRLHKQGLTNIALMLPFVCKVEEFLKAKQHIDFPLKVGIMVETPASAMQIEEFCKAGISFASIGSNDLTQLALGVDRGNTKIAKLYSELDPGVLALIKKTIEGCKKFGIECSICGEAGSDPRMVEKLVEFGIDSISCEIDAVDTIRAVVARTERKLILEGLRKERSTKN